MASKLTKVHLSGDEPLTAEGPQGVLVETLCNRYCLKPIVVSLPQYAAWIADGLTDSIFCDHCRREADNAPQFQPRAFAS